MFPAAGVFNVPYTPGTLVAVLLPPLQVHSPVCASDDVHTPATLSAMSQNAAGKPVLCDRLETAAAKRDTN